MKLFGSTTNAPTTCRRCGKEISLFGQLDFNKVTGRCGACEDENRMALNRFRDTFLSFCRDGLLSSDEWTHLIQSSQAEGIDFEEALEFVRGDAVQLLERTLTIAAADGAITEQEYADIHQLRMQLQIPSELAQPLLDRLTYLQQITHIRQGKLPITETPLRLESDEVCHFSEAAAYHKIDAESVTVITGHLVATNKKLYFLSPSSKTEISYTSIKRIDQQVGGMYLELSKKTGNGFYRLAEPLWAEAIIDALVRIANGDVFQADEAASHHIPHDVKIAVWQRDQGRCVQCKATSYLEFDYIIPFSKGGASTIGNVQLLCRKCNLAQGDQI